MAAHTSSTKMGLADAIVPQHSAGFEQIDPPALVDYGGGLSPAGVRDMARPAPVSARHVMRHKGLMLFIFLLVAAAAIPPIWLLIVPEYESTASVRIAPVIPRIVFSTENNRMVPLYQSFRNTQVAAIRSPIVLERVLDREEVRATHWYRDEGEDLLGNRLPPMSRMVRDLVVKPRRDTELIDISIATLRPREAKVIVDAVVSEYDRFMKDKEREDFLDIIERVKDRYNALQSEIRGLEDTRYKLWKGLGLTDSTELRALLSTDLSRLQADSMQMRRVIALLEARKDKLESEKLGRVNATGEPRREDEAPPPELFSQDPEWRSVKQQLDEAAYALSISSYGPAHPKRKEQASRVDYFERMLAAREAQLTQQWRSGPALDPVMTGAGGQRLVSGAAIERELLEKRLEKELLDKDIEQQRSKVLEVQEIARHEEQINHKRQEFEDVRRRLTELETEAKAPGRIEIASLGLAATEPRRDRRVLLTLLAIGGAMFSSLAVGYLRSSLDSTIRDTEDIRHSARMPFLGRLPLLPGRELYREIGGKGDRTLFTVVRGSLQPVMTDAGHLNEGIRNIRTALVERLNGKKGATVVVTSPTSRAGKSSVSVLLATSLAALGKRVLLVEANFYSPCLSIRLNVRAESGLARLLAGLVDRRKAVYPTTNNFLDVVPLGEIPQDFDAESLANGSFLRHIDCWKEEYDFIVLDSSPVLLAADARILATRADGVLMVVKASHNRRSEAAQAYHQLAGTGTNLLGVVLVGGRPEQVY